MHKLIMRLEAEIETYRGEEVESVCLHCEKPFTQYRVGRLAKFCSHVCRQSAYRENKEFRRVFSHVDETFRQHGEGIDDEYTNS